MYCPKCGKQIKDDARFCGYCGCQIQTKKVCPICNHEVEMDMIYCSYCGNKIVNDTKPTVNPAKQNNQNQVNTYQNPNNNNQNNGVLLTLQASWYPGEVKVGIAKGTGTLKVYNNRIEFDKKIGSSASAVFGAVGMAVSASKAKKSEAMVFPMNQIAQIRESSYGGMFPAMVIVLKNGEKHTFAGSFNRQKINECINLVRRYL